MTESMYRVHFSGEKVARMRGFQGEAEARDWAGKNQPDRIFVLVRESAKRFGGGPILSKFKRHGR